MTAQQKQTVEFDLSAEVDLPLLAVNYPDGRSVGVYELERDQDAGWHTDLQLTPGCYTARYYTSTARRVLYFGPAFPNAGAATIGIEAMDGLFVVPPFCNGGCAMI